MTKLETLQDIRTTWMLRFEKWFSRVLYLLGALVVLAAQDPSWASILGKWGGVATLLIGLAAGEIRKARESTKE